MDINEVVDGSVSARRGPESCGELQLNAGQLDEPIVKATGRDVTLTCQIQAQVSMGETFLSLSAPTLDPSQNAVLDPAQNRAVLRIKAYPGMVCGDRLELSWSGIDPDGSAYLYTAQRYVSSAQVGKEIIFVVRGAHISALDGGAVDVHYTLSTASRTVPVESPRLRLQVGDARQELQAARVDEAYSGWLDPERVAEGARITIRPYASMAAGDTVFLSWVGNTSGRGVSDALRIEQFAVGRDISFWIDPHYITPNFGSLITFSYFVEHPGQAIRYSEKVQVMIGVREPLPLSIPNVLEADDGELDVCDALDGITVVIDEPSVEQGELVYLKCDGTNFSHHDSKEASGNAETVFIVPYRFWRGHQDSTVRVSYSVERLDDTSQTSEVLKVFVRSDDLPL